MGQCSLLLPGGRGGGGGGGKRERKRVPVNEFLSSCVLPGLLLPSSGTVTSTSASIELGPPPLSWQKC